MHRGHEEAPAGAGRRHVEQPAFLVQERCGLAGHPGEQIGVGRGSPGPPGAPGTAGQVIDQVLGSHHGATQPQIRPEPLLDTGDHDDVPLQTLGRVGGQDAYRGASIGGGRQRVAGQLLPEHVIEEHVRSRAGHPVDETGRGFEQRDHGVEVAIGRRASCTAPGALRRPSLGQRRGAPERPQHVLDRGAGLGRGTSDGIQRVRHRVRRTGPSAPYRGQLGRAGQRLDQQITGWAAVTGGRREGPQLLAQPSLGQRIGTAERRVQQRDRGFLVEPGRREAAAQREQQRRDRRLRRERQIVGERDGRDMRLMKCPAQRCQPECGGFDDDRHPVPRHAVDQVRLAQPMCDVRGFASGRPERERLRAGLHVIDGGKRSMTIRTAEPIGDAPRGGEQRPGRTEALCQRDRRCDGAGRGCEPLRELVHRGRVGAPETVRRRIRVGERDEMRTIAGDQAQQVDLGRVGVGELVDVHMRQATPFGGQQCIVAAQKRDRGPDDLRVVVADTGPAGRVAKREHLVVLGQEPSGGAPVGTAVELADAIEFGGTDAALGRSQQQVT